MQLFTAKQAQKLTQLKNRDFSFVEKQWSSSKSKQDSGVIQRARAAETVLSRRTKRILLVLDRCDDHHNQWAVLRTAECLGIQHVWIVLKDDKSMNIKGAITRGNHKYLSLRTFATPLMH